MSFFLVSLTLAIVVGVLRSRMLASERPILGGRPLPTPARRRPAPARRTRVVIDEAA